MLLIFSPISQLAEVMLSLGELKAILQCVDPHNWGWDFEVLPDNTGTQFFPVPKVCVGGTECVCVLVVYTVCSSICFKCIFLCFEVSELRFA